MCAIDTTILLRAHRLVKAGLLIGVELLEGEALDADATLDWLRP